VQETSSILRKRRFASRASHPPCVLLLMRRVGAAPSICHRVLSVCRSGLRRRHVAVGLHRTHASVIQVIVSDPGVGNCSDSEHLKRPVREKDEVGHTIATKEGSGARHSACTGEHDRRAAIAGQAPAEDPVGASAGGVFICSRT